MEDFASSYNTKFSSIEVSFGVVEDAFDVRYEVFVSGQGIDEGLDRDGRDDKAVQFVYYNSSSKPVGTVRLRKTGGNKGKIERLAVLNQFRGEKIGSKLINELETFAENYGLGIVKMSAQKDVEGFYTELGYSSFGEIYEEAGIPHIKMRKKLR